MRKSDGEAAIEVGCQLLGCGVMTLLNMTVGALAFDYCLWQLVQKNVPWYADVLCGLFCGQFAVPLAVIIFILKCFGIEVYLGHAN